MSPLDVTPLDVIVDNTILASTAACSTRTALHYVLGLTTEGEAKALVAGQYVHEVLAWWLMKFPPDVALARLDGYKKWAKAHGIADDDRLAYRNVKRIMQQWMQTRPLNKWPLVVEPTQVEVPLVGVLGFLPDAKKPTKIAVVEKGERRYHKGEPRVVMVALLDALGQRRTGGHYSIDHKSTQNVNEYFKDEQEDSSQFTGQLWLAGENGHTLHGIFINAVELWTVPSSSRKCKTHGTLYSECGITHLKHFLFPVNRSEHEIATWPVTARMLATKYLRLRRDVTTIEDVRELPMEGRFTRACRNCAFRKFCKGGRQTFQAKEFVKQEWHPLEHAKELANKAAEARK